MFNKLKAGVYMAIVIAGWSLSGLVAAQEDGGTDVVLAAQNDAAPVQPSTDPQQVLSDWVGSKGWTDGWDSSKNRFIMVGEVSGRIRPTQRNFLDKRAALYTELELRLKAKIIESLVGDYQSSRKSARGAVQSAQSGI